MAGEAPFSAQSRRPRPLTLIVVALLHLLAIYALAKAFAPGATASVERAVLESFTVTVPVTPPPPPPPPQATPDSGKSGEAGRKAVPKAVVAPKPPIIVKPAPPAPRASSTGTADSSGAQASGSGSGTGAGGSGTGTGSGNGGSGQGGGIATRPQLISGAINAVRDYPMPPGGYQARRGTEVVVKVTVGTNGRASNCSVFRASPDAEADAITCRLVTQRLRFRPATDTSGAAVAAPFYWRQRWF